MVDQRIMVLAVAVDAPIPLLQPVWVPGNLVVNQPVTVALQVDALRGGIGGQQNAHVADVRRR